MVYCFTLYLLLSALVHLIVCEVDRYPSEMEMDIFRKLESIKTNNPRIMFWRPQKVGSSTLLSLLVSYGYRYNYLPRRKASMNSLCKEIAK